MTIDVDDLAMRAWARVITAWADPRLGGLPSPPADRAFATELVRLTLGEAVKACEQVQAVMRGSAANTFLTDTGRDAYSNAAVGAEACARAIKALTPTKGWATTERKP